MQNNQIYLGFIQIADLVADRILAGEYQAGMRIPSVREMSMELEVNPQTVVRGYERLTRIGAIYTQRGLGFFVSQQALEILRKLRTERLYGELLPALKKELELLQLSPEVVEQYFLHEAQKLQN